MSYSIACNFSNEFAYWYLANLCFFVWRWTLMYEVAQHKKQLLLQMEQKNFSTEFTLSRQIDLARSLLGSSLSYLSPVSHSCKIVIGFWLDFFSTMLSRFLDVLILIFKILFAVNSNYYWSLYNVHVDMKKMVVLNFIFCLIKNHFLIYSSELKNTSSGCFSSYIFSLRAVNSLRAISFFFLHSYHFYNLPVKVCVFLLILDSVVCKLCFIFFISEIFLSSLVLLKNPWPL